MGSLTGAVASQRVPEACKGGFRLINYQSLEYNGINLLNCKTDMSNRNENWS